MQAIPVGEESKESDFELIKSKMEKRIKPVEKIMISFLNLFDLII
jgi:hypothetical protein